VARPGGVVAGGQAPFPQADVAAVPAAPILFVKGDEAAVGGEAGVEA
jgi:hypothetical protein